MQPTVIIVNGFPNAGKDETVRQTVIHLKNMGVNSTQFSSIDPFRDAVRALGLDPEKKTPAMRALLSEFKASADRHFDYSTGKLAELCRYHFNRPFALQPNQTMAAFIHIREPHNIAKLKEALKHEEMVVLTVMVQGNRSLVIDSNVSDQEVENYEYDVLINNNGTIEELALGCFDLAARIARRPSPRRAKEPASTAEAN